MNGYYLNEEATKEVMTEDGWLKPGDIGKYDENKFLYVTDRLKELIKVRLCRLVEKNYGYYIPVLLVNSSCRQKSSFSNNIWKNIDIDLSPTGIVKLKKVIDSNFFSIYLIKYINLVIIIVSIFIMLL